MRLFVLIFNAVEKLATSAVEQHENLRKRMHMKSIHGNILIIFQFQKKNPPVQITDGMNT